MPESINQKHYDKWLSDPFLINETIKTKDDIELDAMFYNNFRKPSYDTDIIVLYSHGNSGCCCSVLESSAPQYFLNRPKTDKISVFVYDYRGYGRSTGKASSYGCLKDSIAVYKFLINDKKVDPKRIILFGNSLGCCVTSYLMDYILNHYIASEKPKIMIIQNPFQNIHRICNEVVPGSGYFLFSPLQTDKYIKNIDNNTNHIDMCFIHSKSDELIHYSHSVDLAAHVKNNKSKVIMLGGGHANPIHNQEFDDYINMIMRSRFNLK